MGLAIETTKNSNLGEGMNQEYICVQDALTQSRSASVALQEKFESIRKDLQSKISLRLRIKWNRLRIKWNSPILTLMQSRVKRLP